MNMTEDASTHIEVQESKRDDAYPRPDFTRPNQNWKSLNGIWNIAFDDRDEGLRKSWHINGIPSDFVTHDIKVPFVFQTPESGINDRGAHEVLWYEREIEDLRKPEEKERGNLVLLRFGAVDYECKIWIDGVWVGGHRGGHVSFDIDITEALTKAKDGKARLALRVFDSAYDLAQPRGKQYWKPEPESIFYTPSSGIWQNVWMEVVPKLRIADPSCGTFLRTDDIKTGNLSATIAVLGRRVGEDCTIEISAKFQEAFIIYSQAKAMVKSSDSLDLELEVKIPKESAAQGPAEKYGNAKDDLLGWKDGLALWSPEYPNLYEITIKLYSEKQKGYLADEVQTWVGIRSLDWTAKDGTFKLNGEPYFQALILDQGYWPETGMTPPNRAALKEDILLSKKMGFNGCRKHQKVEDPVFLHYADKLGYIVWSEMGNAYRFDQRYVDKFDEEWKASMKRDINHACIVAWTPVNESWGYPDLPGSKSQRDHIKSLYFMTK